MSGRLSFRNTQDRVLVLVLLQACFAILGFLGEAVADRFVLKLTFVAQFGLLIMCLNFHLRALRRLYNTFWSLTLMLLVFYGMSFFRNALVLDNPFTAVWYGLSLMLLALASWQISSPLYYPMVQWWEYDFRFRPDIRISVVDGGEEHRARLTDLRRGAGCVVMFHAVPEGSTIEINTDVLQQRFRINAQVVSRKEQIVGRAYLYGVRFQVDDLEQKQRLKLLTNYWHESKKLKIRHKFDTLR